MGGALPVAPGHGDPVAAFPRLREYLTLLNSATSSAKHNRPGPPWGHRAMRHVLSILLQNETGALSRVASMFSTRGFNIESLSVAPTNDELVSRLTLVTSGTEDVIGQISKQLGKLVDVVAIADRTGVNHLERELGLVKFAVDSAATEPFHRLVANYGARILDDHPEHFTIEVTGNERQVDTFLAAIPPGVRVLSVVRSGPLVISKGPQALF